MVQVNRIQTTSSIIWPTSNPFFTLMWTFEPTNPFGRGKEPPSPQENRSPVIPHFGSIRRIFCSSTVKFLPESNFCPCVFVPSQSKKYPKAQDPILTQKPADVLSLWTFSSFWSRKHRRVNSDGQPYGTINNIPEFWSILISNLRKIRNFNFRAATITQQPTQLTFHVPRDRKKRWKGDCINKIQPSLVKNKSWLLFTVWVVTPCTSRGQRREQVKRWWTPLQRLHLNTHKNRV